MKTLGLIAGAALIACISASGAFAMGPDPAPVAAPRAANSAQKDFEDGQKAINAAQYDKGIELMKKVVAAQPKNADAYNLLGFAYRKKGDMRSAAGNYDAALKIDASHKGALEYQGEMFLKLGRLDDAYKNRVRLRDACPSGCNELRELDRAIADFHKSAPKT
jgi:tetratricopeptide (TPR) repeat protein